MTVSTTDASVDQTSYRLLCAALQTTVQAGPHSHDRVGSIARVEQGAATKTPAVRPPSCPEPLPTLAHQPDPPPVRRAPALITQELCLDNATRVPGN